MTRKDLREIYHINREIEMWEKELEDCREKAAARSKPITGMPFANTNAISDTTADIAMECFNIEVTILGFKKQLEVAKLRVIRGIAEIEDSFTRQLVKYRSLDGLSWEEIADLMGYERTTCSKKYKEFESTLREE